MDSHQRSQRPKRGGGFPFDRIPRPGAERVKTAMIGASALMLVLIAALALRIDRRDRAYEQWADEYNQDLRAARRESDDANPEPDAPKSSAPDAAKSDAARGPVRVLIIGNDTGAGRGASSPDSDWAHVLSHNLSRTYESEIEMENLSMPGNSPYAGFVRIVKLLGENDKNHYPGYDLAIVCYAPDEDLEVFPACYEALIRTLRRGWPECDILAALDTAGREKTENYMKNIENMRLITDDYHILAADMDELLNGADYYVYKNLVTDADSAYLNDWGHAVYGRILNDMIDNAMNKRENNNNINNNIDDKMPVIPGAAEFENYIYYSADAFARDGSNFILELDKPVSGRVGFYGIRVPGLNGWQVYGDENFMAGREFYWESEPGEHISLLPADQIVTAGNQISVLLYNDDFSPAAGDNFLGICFTRGPDL